AISPEIFETFRERVYPGGLTYSGHPLACAAAVATITAMEEESMVWNAKRLGEEIIGPRLAQFAAGHPSVGEVRGRGVVWAIELVKDRETREPEAAYGGSSPEMNQVVAAAKSAGLLPFANFNRLHVVPAMNIEDSVLIEALDRLEQALTAADTFVQ